jgi:hypothetical protein
MFEVGRFAIYRACREAVCIIARARIVMRAGGQRENRGNQESSLSHKVTSVPTMLLFATVAYNTHSCLR